MKQYLLFAFGDFGSYVTVENMVETVATVTNSDYTKFKQHKNYLVFNFATELSHDNLENYINSNFSNVTECHFLMEVTDNSSIYMNTVDLECFLQLYESKNEEWVIRKPKNGDVNKTMSDEQFFKKLFGFDTSIQADSWDEFDDIDDDDIEKYQPKLELNKILDKISTSGIKSLTKEERNYLKTY